MSVELKIQKLLNQHSKLEFVVEELLNLAASSGTRSNEIASVTQFLIHSGYLQDAFRQYPRRFFEQSKISFPHFIEIIERSKIKVPKEVVEAIIEGAREKKKVPSLVLNRKWDKKNSFFKETREKLWQKKIDDLELVKDKMKQKIEFLKTNHMLEEEDRTFRKFMMMFPEDAKLQDDFAQFKERWAREVVSKKIESNKTEETYKIYSVPKLTIEEISLCQTIFDDCDKKCKNNKSLSYDFALLFQFIEAPSFAIQILEYADDTEAKDWLMADLYFDNEQYLELLNFVDQLQTKYESDPEAQFATTYLRAKTMQRLGHHSRAIELLNDIIAVRADYRSAQSLVITWAKDPL